MNIFNWMRWPPKSTILNHLRHIWQLSLIQSDIYEFSNKCFSLLNLNAIYLFTLLPASWLFYLAYFIILIVIPVLFKYAYFFLVFGQQCDFLRHKKIKLNKAGNDSSSQLMVAFKLVDQSDIFNDFKSNLSNLPQFYCGFSRIDEIPKQLDFELKCLSRERVRVECKATNLYIKIDPP